MKPFLVQQLAMAKHPLFPSFLVFLLLQSSLIHGEPKSSLFSTVQCSRPSTAPDCSSLLYVVPGGLSNSEIATRYSANASRFQPINRTSSPTPDVLVEVPCACEAAGNVTALFHDTNYTVKPGDTADKVKKEEFSGLAWGIPENINAADNITVLLLCGCSTAAGVRAVVTYSVQENDTLTGIAQLLGTDAGSILVMNPELIDHPDFVRPGQVLFVPQGAYSPPPPPGASNASPGTATGAAPPPSKGVRKTTVIILSISMSILFIILCGLLILIFYRRRRSAASSSSEINVKANLSKTSSARHMAALQSQFLSYKFTEGTATFMSERPVIYTLEEVDQATANFDESRKIGEGGYGSVYFGILGTQEVAIKKMKSSKSKEFFAELNVLCKVHHKNVVELIGYATGDDHLYLVYEYVQNGSLSEHLHDPLLKGHQPLSWTARTQIGLDAARGIEYIHDHTKATYVHRDIKTSNILLDSALRAKIADFGLAKLVEHSEEQTYLATRLVGTPGYLPPESVRELQMTTKCDVFAFGVVLAELVTGKRALIPDKDPSKMRSLVTVMKGIFLTEDPKAALEEIIDQNLNGAYPMEEVYKMVDMAMWCLCDDPVSRPEMRDITANLSQILMASIEWEASLGGNSQVFSGVFTGR